MYRKIIIVFILMLTLVGCNQEVIDNGDDINNGDTINIEDNIEDNIENDEINSSPDIEMIQIEDMDSYVESLYDDVFGFNKTAFKIGLFHNENLVTVKDLTLNEINNLAYYAVYETINTKEGYDGLCFYYNDYASTVTRLFGDSVSASKDEWWGGGCSWVYNESIDAFLGEPTYGGEERKLFDCRYFGKYELDGDYLYIYDRCYYCEYDNDSGLTFFYNDINKTPESLFLKWEIKANYDIYYIGDEVTQKYGAEYKHTFAKAKNGSYYWVSSEPVAPDILVSNEKDILADLYVNDLYDYIIVHSDEVNCFHSDSMVESFTLSMQDMKCLAYYVGFFDNVVYSGAGTGYGKYFDFEDLDHTIKRIFGPNVEVDTEEWYAGGMSFVYEERMNRFGGDASSGGDLSTEMIFDYFGKYELDGDYLYIYDRVLFCTHDRFDTGIIKFYSDINKTEESFVNEMQVGSYLPSDFSNDEALSQYGAEYKHTFKLTDDGSYYYWVSSEPVE